MKIEMENGKSFLLISLETIDGKTMVSLQGNVETKIAIALLEDALKACYDPRSVISSTPIDGDGSFDHTKNVNELKKVFNYKNN